MEIKEHVDLAPYTTLKVGGPARYFVVVHTTDELAQVRQFAQQAGVPVLVLGQGSNVLVSKQGYAGVVIINQILGRAYKKELDESTLVSKESLPRATLGSLTKGGPRLDLTKESGSAVSATFGSGENWDEMVADTVHRGLWGLENLSHIPGTVGATPVQNVGAYGVEVSDRITAVDAFSLLSGESKTFTNAECEFTYRDSFFKTDAGRDWIITSVTFSLSKNNADAVVGYADLQTFAESNSDFTQLELRSEIIRIRSQKFPDWQQVGTAGSFFKNPIITKVHLDELLATYGELRYFPQPNGEYKIALGWVLDKICGLRGYCDGAVCLSQHQALVLLNHGDSATAVVQFVTDVQTAVYKKTKINIEPEVRFV
jgi:UDP-N-acetylmuramate dehydrogenase